MTTRNEKPMLFRAPLVRAILDGHKTVTRRVVKAPIPSNALRIRAYRNRIGNQVFGPVIGQSEKLGEITELSGIKCPYGQPGERIWVRETWYCDHFEVMRGPYLKPNDLDVGEAINDGTLVYAADGLTPYEADQPIWKPSIHMPRWASRILLEITDVRVERLHAITNEQCVAEGARGGHGSIPGYIYNATAQEHFRYIWESTGGDYFANPWVWVIEFKQVKQARSAAGERYDA